jgi:hypothetical protein
MWYKTRLNSIPPNVIQFSGKMSWFRQLVGNVSEYVYKKLTIKLMENAPYFIIFLCQMSDKVGL